MSVLRRSPSRKERRAAYHVSPRPDRAPSAWGRRGRLWSPSSSTILDRAKEASPVRERVVRPLGKVAPIAHRLTSPAPTGARGAVQTQAKRDDDTAREARFGFDFSQVKI